MSITVIGAGLAGCEAAWQIASKGEAVTLYEMKPKKYSPAHSSEQFAELICSNSFKADRVESAAGLLKEEMRRFHSLLMECADQCRVPAGGALAVDRDRFSQMVTEKIKSNPLIKVVSEEVTEIPKEGITVIATGFENGEEQFIVPDAEAEKAADSTQKEDLDFDVFMDIFRNKNQ